MLIRRRLAVVALMMLSRVAGLSKGRVVVVGGGASGYFAAISAARHGAPSVEILESASKGLAKVLASGGGRCNVMHQEMDPMELVRRYPRGERELRGPLTGGFSQADARSFFEEAGVTLKTEEDGRVFPTTDDARTIASALQNAARDAGVTITFGAKVQSVRRRSDATFRVELLERNSSKAQRTADCDAVIIATGSAPIGYDIARSFDHKTTKPYPSLFSLRIPEGPLRELAGVTLEDAQLDYVEEQEGKKKKKPKPKFSQRGGFLVTHRGISGPAALKLSAFCAAELKQAGYRGTVLLNSLPNLSASQVQEQLLAYKKQHPSQQVAGANNPNRPFVAIPKRLWQAMAQSVLLNPLKRWGELSKKDTTALSDACSALRLDFDGKDTNKEEFVTAGGVELAEIDLRRFASKTVPGLHFVGELLNVDGVTGGHNFQNCWTSGWVAGASAAKAVLATDADDSR